MCESKMDVRSMDQGSDAGAEPVELSDSSEITDY